MANSNDYMRQYMARRRSARRAQLVELLGGICAQCGSSDALEIDHRDPKTKSFTFSGAGLDKPWADILAEAAHCQLLCGAHHLQKTRDERLQSAHGTQNRYAKYKCRCDQCKSAYSNWKRSYRRSRAARGLPAV